MNDSLAVPEYAAEAILRLVAEEGVRAGDRLPSQRELAERLGVSRTSLREALSTPAARGVIRSQAGKGVFFLGSDTADTGGGWPFASRVSPAEVFQLRYGLEGFVAGLACASADPEDLDWLEDNVASLRVELKAGQFEAAARLDYAFHRRLAAIAGNRAISDWLDSSAEVLIESQKLPFQRPDRAMETHSEHLRILRALQRQAPSAASRAMQEHIRRAAARIGIRFAGVSA